MRELASPHYEYMINSCTCFSQLLLHKLSRWLVHSLFPQHAIFPIHCKTKFKLLKSWFLVHEIQVARGSLTGLTDVLYGYWRHVARYDWSSIYTVWSDAIIIVIITGSLKLQSNRKSKYLCLKGQPKKKKSPQQTELINKTGVRKMKMYKEFFWKSSE